MNIAEELNKLQNLYDDANVPLEKGSIDKSETFTKIMSQFSASELDALAIEYAALHPQIYHLSQCETPDNLLGPILSTRCGKLNRALEFTPVEIARYLHINERVECCLKKAADEIQMLAAQLDKRIKENDPFFNDYEIEIHITPFISEAGEGIEAILCGILPEFSYSLQQLAEKDNIMFDSNWYDLCGVPKDRLEGHHICYFMHEIWEHTLWSLPDILRINEIWAELYIRYQHFEENI